MRKVSYLSYTMTTADANNPDGIVPVEMCIRDRYVARYRYNPGTMITIAGTVIDIREYPILPFERDASIPAVRAPAKAAIDGGQEARSTSSRRRVLAMAPMKMCIRDSLWSDHPKKEFTISITDDVTGLSLPPSEMPYSEPASQVSCKFWGLGRCV